MNSMALCPKASGVFSEDDDRKLWIKLDLQRGG
jgi:hypothetical protein